MASRRKRKQSSPIDGERLRRWREENGLTQGMAARVFGYSRETWVRFENGDAIHPAVIYAISCYEQLQDVRVQLAMALNVGGVSPEPRGAPRRR